MPAITVKIERAEDGSFSVGEDTADNEMGGGSMDSLMQGDQGQQPGPSGGGMQMAGGMGSRMPMAGGMEGREDTGMQPAADIEDALAKARVLLAGEPAQPTEQASAQRAFTRA